MHSSAIPLNVPKFIEKWQLDCKCHPSAVIIIWQFAVCNRVLVIELQFEDMTIGSSSKDVFERARQPEVRPSPFLYALTCTNLYC